MASNSKSADMCSGSLYKNIFVFSMPLMASGLLQLLYNAADVIVVGRYAGQESLAAVGTTGAIINLILNIFIGLSGGVSVAMARAVGAKNDHDIHDVVHTSILISFIAGAFLTVAGSLLAHPMLKLISVPDDIMPQAVAYMRMIFYGMIPSMLYNFGSAILRSKGDTKRPLYIVSVAGIINIILNLWFVIQFKMGAAGVGLATSVSQTVSAVLVLMLLMRETDSSRLILKKLKLNKKQLMFIVKIGIPAGMQGATFSLSNVVIQSGVNSFGSACMAASAASCNIEGFMFTALNTFSQASMTFISQNIGAEKYDRIGKTIRVCYVYAGILSVFVALLGYFGGAMLMKIYCPGEREAIIIGHERLKIIATTYFLCAFQDILCGSLRGMGASFSGMIISILGVCGTRLIWIYTVFRRFHSFNVLLISYPLSWIATGIMYIILYIIVKKKYTQRITA